MEHMTLVSEEYGGADAGESENFSTMVWRNDRDLH